MQIFTNDWSTGRILEKFSAAAERRSVRGECEIEHQNSDHGSDPLAMRWEITDEHS